MSYNKINNTKGKPKSTGKNVNKKNMDKKFSTRPGSMDGIKSDIHTSGCNDPAWYSKNPQLVKDVASFPFGSPVGTPIQLSVGRNNGFTTYRIGGVMNIKYVPTVDIGGDEASPINVAATNLYAFMRQANSGAKNYDPADLIQYILALDSLYILHAEMRRLYGIANAYTPTNKYYSRGLIYSLGYDPDEVYSNMAQLRALVNLTARQLATYRLPSKLSYIERHQWMSSGMFTDSTSAKAQTYMFQCHAYWKYNNTSETGTSLSMTNMESEGFGNGVVSDLANLWNALYQPLQNDEDVGIISGDILKAFGTNVLTVAEIPEAYTVIPTYDERVLMQIHNSVSVMKPDSPEIVESTIVQDPSVNEGHVTMTLNIGEYYPGLWATYSTKRLLNYYKGDVTPDDVMEATRLMASAYYSTSAQTYELKLCGSEVVLWYTITTLSGDSFSNKSFNNVFYLDADEAVINGFNAYPQFDWAPICYLISEVGANERMILADIDTYTILDAFEIEMMHRVALLSEFEYY